MIRDLEAYARLRVEEQDRELEKLGAKERIAIAEALLSSSLIAQFAPRSRPRPVNLVRALRIDPSRVVRTAKPTRP